MARDIGLNLPGLYYRHFQREQERDKNLKTTIRLQSVLHALRGGRFNWDLMPFLAERPQDILDGKDQDKIYETKLASCWFAESDRAHFERFARLLVLLYLRRSWMEPTGRALNLAEIVEHR